MSLMSNIGSPLTGQVQCPDCGMYYKNRNTMNSHRSTYCPKRNSIKMIRKKEMVVKEWPRDTGITRTVLKQANIVKEQPRVIEGNRTVLKPLRTYLGHRNRKIEVEFSDADLAYSREFEQFSETTGTS